MNKILNILKFNKQKNYKSNFKSKKMLQIDKLFGNKNVIARDELVNGLEV